MTDHQYDDVWVVIPVFNEAPVVRGVVEHVLSVFPHVVCVDDGSSDGSIDEVAATGAHLVRHPVNLGQGASIETGLAYARARAGAAYFVTFDADGQHRTSDAEAMVALARTGEADVVLGTRFAEGNDAHVPRLKRIVLRIAALTSPSSRRLKLTDAHNGLRVVTKPVADEMRITMNGMAHASEIVQHLSRSAWRVREIPVTIDYTDYSRSKGQSLVNGINILFDLSLRQRKG